MLRLVAGLPFYEIELAAFGQGRRIDAPEQRTKLPVTTRSLLESMSYLCHAINVPPEHIERGWSWSRSTRTGRPSIGNS
jgi:hypothetical protein